MRKLKPLPVPEPLQDRLDRHIAKAMISIGLDKIKKSKLTIGRPITRKKRGYGEWLYPDEFNRELKLLIRRRDNWKCRICSCPQEECETNLHVHHIDEDKANLNPVNLISLCKSCHFGVHNGSVSFVSSGYVV